MRDLLPDLVVAPMAGGPSTPALVTAAAQAGALGFLAAGYQTPPAVETALRAVAGVPHGLNIFVPTPPAAPEPIERYRDLLQAEAQRYDIELPPVRLSDDDHFAAKIELAEAYRVPLVSFTFGVPDRRIVARLQAAGCRILITVTSAREAVQAVAVAPDGLIAQGGSAGGHAATLDAARYRGDSSAGSVLAAVRKVTDLPVIAAGGTGSAADVAALLDAGAVAVQAGTAFLLADEAGTRPAHRAALLAGEETVVTRAFTGWPARALRNRFTDTYSAAAPIGYPAVHHLTAPIRAAAAARGDAEALNLWAGTAFATVHPGPAADMIARLRQRT
ncbi:nitronate monooxygenase [Symbioplanes lichenis]|uniref:nitronate monooxygenase n=1 Tax=Symbioplanes lichenis TaxID=1629072 RepID=UPI0027394221|nr:nitronate monooxygenase [Actinoplanes lichenis]